MKKNYLFGAALMALAWTSCTQDDSLNLVGEDNSVFTGEMEFVGSRTSLGEDNKISWVLEDELSIFKKNNINRQYKVASIDNGKATFSYLDNVTPATVEAISANYAVYPYSEDNTITSAGVISAPIEYKYEYENRTRFISSALMASKSTGTNFSFKNVQGYLRLRLCAEIPEDYESAVKSVTLTSTKALSGTAEITFGTDGIPTAEIKENVGNSLTVDLKTPQRLATKASGNYVELYVPVVPMTFGAGEITLTINFEDGTTFSKENGKAITIARREVTGMMLEISADGDFTGDIEGAEEAWDGETATVPTPVMDETTGEEYYPIVKASDLAGLAALVNGTTSRAAAEVRSFDIRLTCDIDLGGKQWTPIGTETNNFIGTFDGNGHTLKNLFIEETEAKEGKAFVGFFGYAKNATIKNVTFENVNLNIACLDIDHSQGHIGAVAGSLEGKSTIENVTVKGDIKVEATLEANGASRVAVVAGGNSYGEVTMKNVHVQANEGSYLKANNNVGALAGQLQHKSVFEDCTSNIDVTGYKFFAGGIIGLAAGDQTFTNCHTTGDVKILAGREGRGNDHYRVGGIAGGWADGKTNVCTLTNCSYTGEISGTNADGSVAEIFDYAGYVGRGYTLNGCGGSKVIIDGTSYIQAKDNVHGQYIIVNEKGEYLVANATDLLNVVGLVEDGKTIKLTDNVTFDADNRYNNGGYWDGLGYSGDKSFTIDLGGKTISQDGALNDYLMWFKNDGSKDNTITLKNGTLDAGTTAYCALATSSSNAQKITINLEDVNLINNNSNGAVVKARGGSELNVKAGTIITGKNSYTGIEAAGTNTVVNIYDGAEIYQNGTSSYVGAIVGASQNATLNIFGGKGKSAKCGIIVMSTGATINVSGGEWIANNDGTVAGGNQGVLVSQNNRNESGWACKSVMNVTGGTFKGGYDCWGMGPGVEADDAQINIKGGNFNADPTQYVVAGYEVTGNYTVAKPQALVALEEAIAKGGNVTLANDVTLLESLKIENTVVLDLNGKTITAPLFSAFEVKTGGELTIKNGKVVAYESTVRAIGGKATIESGEYTSTGTALDTPSTYRYSLDCREGGELIVNGGTFKSNNGMINVGSTVTINGGKFENIVEKSMTRHFAYVSALLTINDGEFYGKANGGAGGCFFCGAAEGCDIQVKGGKFTSLWTSGSVNKIFESYYGGNITVTGGMFNTNGGIATFVTENTDEATKVAYPYVAK